MPTIAECLQRLRFLTPRDRLELAAGCHVAAETIGYAAESWLIWLQLTPGIVNEVADAGIDITALRTAIEYAYLYGSRRREIQRFGRLLHSPFKRD